MIQVAFQTPRLTGYIFPPRSLTFEPLRYSKMDVGGSDSAEIEVTGDRFDLPGLINYLRYGVELTGEDSLVLWSGYVNKVELQLGSVTLVMSMDDIANRVNVAYTMTALGAERIGIRNDSAWKIDQDSIDRYGIKEMKEAGGNMSIAAAEALAQRYLDERAWGNLEVSATGEAAYKAKFYCLGWWHSLSWRLVYVPAKVSLSYRTIGTLDQPLGGSGGKDGLAEPIMPASPINLFSVRLYVKRVGMPTGNLTVAVTDVDPEGMPGNNQASAGISAIYVGTDYGWIDIPLGTPYLWGANVRGFLTVTASGTDDNNYYVLRLDEQQGFGYADFLLKTGSAWAIAAADMPFQLVDNQLIETTQQVKNHIESSGQFLQNVRILNNSGITSESYRNGDTTAQDEVEELLEIGTTNHKRLLATVHFDRSVDIYEQDDNTSAAIYELRDDGNLYYKAAGRIENSVCPVATWLSLDSLLAGANLNSIENKRNCVWIAGSEYDCRTGAYEFWTPGWQNPYIQTMGIGNG